jgi:hypothetical protein
MARSSAPGFACRSRLAMSDYSEPVVLRFKPAKKSRTNVRRSAMGLNEKVNMRPAKLFRRLVLSRTNRKVFFQFPARPCSARVYSSNFGLNLIALGQSSAVLHNLGVVPIFETTG